MMFFDPVREIDVPRSRVFEALGYKETYVPQGFEIPGDASQARLVDEYGSAEAFVKAISATPDQRSVWWVNQGASFRRATEGGYLWAPKVDRQGHSRRDWDALTEVRRGDVVLHYADGKIRGVSTVERQAYDSSRPAPENAASWENNGRRIEVAFRALRGPIALADIPVHLRVAEQGGPFDRNGGVKQGYLFALSDEFTTRMAQRFPELGLSEDGGAPARPLADLSAVWQNFNTALKDCGLTFGDNQDVFIRAFLPALVTKPFVILTGLSGSGKTQLAIKFGQWLGPGRWHIEPVRPDWTGAEALFGYEDALQPLVHGRRAWQVPNALEFILRASRDPGHPYLLILDEMNLAHVERYFSSSLGWSPGSHASRISGTGQMGTGGCRRRRSPNESSSHGISSLPAPSMSTKRRTCFPRRCSTEQTLLNSEFRLVHSTLRPEDLKIWTLGGRTSSQVSLRWPKTTTGIYNTQRQTATRWWLTFSPSMGFSRKADSSSGIGSSTRPPASRLCLPRPASLVP
jgi:hypothetical protein